MTVRWNRSLEYWNGVVSLAVFLVVSHGPVSPCSHPLSPLQLNHFPGSFQIGRKDRLWRNLSRMQSRFGKKEFSFFPQSFILPQDAKLLRKAWESSSRQKWIVKPVSGPGGWQAGPEWERQSIGPGRQILSSLLHSTSSQRLLEESASRSFTNGVSSPRGGPFWYRGEPVSS